MSHARLFAVLLIGGSLGTACAARKPAATAEPAPSSRPTLVVLLPDGDTGVTGRARVTNEFGSVDLAAARDSTLITQDGRPAAVRRLSDADVARTFGAVLDALPAAPRHFTLRFRFESDELTDESRALVPEILKTVKSMPYPEVGVIGHTDTLGDPKSNIALGLKRAMTVRGFLVRAGIDSSTIDITSHGETDLLVKTPNNTAEPRNRRVEIVVR